jgi:hypothetical protein
VRDAWLSFCSKIPDLLDDVDGGADGAENGDEGLMMLAMGFTKRAIGRAMREIGRTILLRKPFCTGPAVVEKERVSDEII